MQLQSPPNPPNPLLPQPPQPPPHTSRSRMMIQQEEPPRPSLQEHPPPHCVADKSLIILPPKIHLQCYIMQGSLGGLHKSLKKIPKYFICMCGNNIV